MDMKTRRLKCKAMDQHGRPIKQNKMMDQNSVFSVDIVESTGRGWAERRCSTGQERMLPIWKIGEVDRQMDGWGMPSGSEMSLSS